MIDREKVIQWLEACSVGCEEGCPYEYDGLVSKVECKADLMRDALELLKELLNGHESLKQKMWNALYAEEDKLENHYVGTDEIDKWIVDYRPFLQRGFEIAIEAIAAHEEGR